MRPTVRMDDIRRAPSARPLESFEPVLASFPKVLYPLLKHPGHTLEGDETNRTNTYQSETI